MFLEQIIAQFTKKPSKNKNRNYVMQRIVTVTFSWSSFALLIWRLGYNIRYKARNQP